jgi:SAM-dependent methyltransferase
MLKQLRRSDLEGVSLWEDHWRQFDAIRYDRGSIRWDGFLDLVDERVDAGPILEAGCGMGRYLLYLKSRGASVCGIDFAREPLQAIRREVGSAPVAAGNLISLPFGTDTFATVLCLGVIEHFEHGPQAVLSELARVLRPEGSLIVTVPYANAMKQWSARRPGTNVVRGADPIPAGWNFYQLCYTEDELAAALAAAGLETVHLRRTGKLFSIVGTLNRARGDSAPAPRLDRSKIAATGGGAFRRALKEVAYHSQRVLPGYKLAHMILAVGRKPRRARPQ